MENKMKNILIVGVGGQGSLLASRIVGTVLMSQGLDVKISEVHGMSQRGGSVVTYIRADEKKVCSPIIGFGGADTIISFELLEAMRWLPYLKKGGQIIVNDQRIDPMPVIMGAKEYPCDIPQKLEAKGAKVEVVDALTIATELGQPKAVNVVLLGKVAAESGIDKQIWIKALEACVPAKFMEINLKAFELGFQSK